MAVRALPISRRSMKPPMISNRPWHRQGIHHGHRYTAGREDIRKMF
jgi:hypothetical protein